MTQEGFWMMLATIVTIFTTVVWLLAYRGNDEWTSGWAILAIILTIFSVLMWLLIGISYAESLPSNWKKT